MHQNGDYIWLIVLTEFVQCSYFVLQMAGRLSQMVEPIFGGYLDSWSDVPLGNTT